ncbi:beta-ketoacyl-ACP synthase II [Tuwongella immobilis]|uniref:3-oxoacyl-[acyl-carrier-protein] synthase 2 n=1 Tax=Tuwongella immobilis TaxID=692036 RepID=A0A6C2YTE0_9BACT|nr:beta-ketoacyl-ACP synthase II [Tuwongella immobilis]VIP04299.1 3-oxoacyl-acp synthase : 3-oxoacyl-[acyl-carrier-protein] synthase 2 OS=uncultured Acidobacteria bacterium A2 PE=3 SV=1: ketoacyl-synt: Ketoacyl-synt_C [Tuwongella immobilis]VTS05961.1 3-oxoacyl-acp synthase : 3-oxoacyl-[acyl-carrier-protein] synthase 2 OS=uncultured Acidobacteria bacterium A2 PE=3 SV=1: ketoacyl-synt: Ketoacyl-synt_C [Tuwongella immobilis]
MTRRRVVITGLGTINPLAHNVPDYWKGLLAGQSGIAKLTLFDTSAFRVQFGGEVKSFQPETWLDPRGVRRMDRFAQFALVASIEAVKDCGIDFSKEDPFRCGVILGSGIGGLNEFEEQHSRYREGGPSRINPFTIPKMIANSAAGLVSIHFGLAGPNTAISTACASAAHAITDATRSIQYNYADVMLCGGSEAAITAMGLGGFISARAVSSRNDDPAGASRPWDKDRDGFVLSEGAGMVVLEELEHAKRRGATIYAEVLGCGSTADAHHITAPHPEGIGASRAMSIALQDAELNPDQVQYINAHGTSTELGDEAETKAIKIVFGDHARKLMVSSTKSMIGHLLGASGGVELIACVLSIRDGVVHPTINYHTPDPACDLDYVPNQPREARVERVLSNSFGFGGHNCSLIIGAVR